MTTFKMPPHHHMDCGEKFYTEPAVKKALRDVLEQAAQLAEGAMHFSEPIASDIRAMKEQIK